MQIPDEGKLRFPSVSCKFTPLNSPLRRIYFNLGMNPNAPPRQHFTGPAGDGSRLQTRMAQHSSEQHSWDHHGSATSRPSSGHQTATDTCH